MALDVLPPSPNWYLSCASSVSGDGILAFATKSKVFLLDITVCPPTFIGSLSGHSERVTSVSCCPAGAAGGTTHLCATAGDDAVIKLWDLRNKSVLQEKKCLENKITALAWSEASKKIIVAGDEKGYVIYWNTESGDVKLLKPEKVSVYSVACSPHDHRIIAVGYKDGKIVLVDALAKRDQVIHSLRGHEEEVQSLAWAPSMAEEAFLKRKTADSETDPASERKGCVLISASRDRTIRFWSTSQGRLLKVVNLPPRGGGGQRPRDRGDESGMKARVWVSLYWSKDRPHRLVSSSHGGDMILWDLSKPSQPKWEMLGGDGDETHMRSVFSIVGRSSDPDRVITTSMDRQVICWNLATLKSEWSLPTLGGFVYCIEPSPLDPARLAVGVGDNMIRVWNTGSRRRAFDLMALWQGIKSKVTVVCWHPVSENSLAYGTEDGRVGVYNVSSYGKQPHLSWTFHKKTVYSLSWGPPCPNPESNHAQSHHLYSCGGEGQIYQHNPAKLDQEATNVNSTIKQTNDFKHLMPQRSDVVWRTDGSAVAIGNDDGSIEVYAPPDLRILCTIHVQTKIINCLRWCPTYTDSDRSRHHVSATLAEPEKRVVLSGHVVSHTDEEATSVGTEQEASRRVGGEESRERSGDSSPGTAVQSDVGIQAEDRLDDPGVCPAGRIQSECRYWLAAGSNSYEVEIYDLAGVFSTPTPQPLSVPITSSYRTLSGHSARVTDVAWSPHGDGRLVSSSYDHTAQVWDVVKGEPIANFRGHGGRAFSCLWSSSDPDVVMTGGEDFCLFTWRISAVNHTRPPKTSRKTYGGQKKSGRKGKKTHHPASQDAPKGDSCDVSAMVAEKITDTGMQVAKDMVATSPGSTQVATASAVHRDSSNCDETASAGGTGKEDGDTKQLLELKKRELLAQVMELEGRIGIDGRASDGERMPAEDEEDEEDEEVQMAHAEELDMQENKTLDSILDRLGPLVDSQSTREISKEKGTVRDMSLGAGKKGRGKRYKSLFPLSGARDNRGKSFIQRDCVDLAMIKQDQVSASFPALRGLDQTNVHLGLFADRKMTQHLLSEEAFQQGESGNFDQQCQLHLWKGNILHPLREATKTGQLTDWLVAMAPLAGHDVWLKTCEAYARQLEEHENFHRAVTYYLLCHQVYKAIAMLKKHGMFRDAVALARVRLLPSDPVLPDLYVTWAQRLESNNSYEPAARCYLAINETLNAIKLLARKGDLPSLRTALHIAILYDCLDDSLVVSIATRYLNSSLATGQWSQALELFSRHQRYKTHAQLVLVYELLVWCLIDQGYINPSSEVSYTSTLQALIGSIQWKDMMGGSGIWLAPTHNQLPLLESLFLRAGMSCEQSHDAPDICVATDDLLGDINQILQIAAQQLLSSHWAQRTGHPDVTIGHLVKVLKTCHDSGYPYVAVGILQLALSGGDQSVSELELQHLQGKSDGVSHTMMCLRAYCKLTELYRVTAALSTRGQIPGVSGATEQETIGSGTSQGDGKSSRLEGTSKDGEERTGEVQADDGWLPINSRMEGYLFHGNASTGTLPWPVTLSSLPLREWVRDDQAAMSKDNTQTDLSIQPASDHVDGCGLSQNLVSRIRTFIEEMHPRTLEIGSVSDNDTAELEQNHSERTVQAVHLDSTNSENATLNLAEGLKAVSTLASDTTRMPHESRECCQKREEAPPLSINNDINGQKYGDFPVCHVVGPSPLEDGNRVKERAVVYSAELFDALVGIKNILLDEQYALSSIVFSKLTSVLPSTDVLGTGLVRQETSPCGWLTNAVATLTEDDLRELAGHADMREALLSLRSNLQPKVEQFPNPLSSCAALLLAVRLLGATLANQSHDSAADLLLRQLCEWSNNYGDQLVTRNV